MKLALDDGLTKLSVSGGHINIGLVTAPESTKLLNIMADITIEIIKNGPYIVNGRVDVKDDDGNAYPAKDRIALCRCGASTTKPFCDGTHSRIGFQAAEKAVPGSAEG